jgi:hypothetical protein
MYKIRKNLVPWAKEEIPLAQWVVIWLLALGLIVSIFSFDSQFLFAESVLKALFFTSIFVVIWTLQQMNNLTFYEKKPGESSIQDLLDIIADKK